MKTRNIRLLLMLTSMVTPGFAETVGSNVAVLREYVTSVFGGPPMEFVSKLDQAELDQETNPEKYLDRITELLARKHFVGYIPWNEVTVENGDIKANQDLRILDIARHNSSLVNKAFEVLTGLNKKVTPSRAIQYLNGEYKTIFLLLPQFISRLDKSTLKDFILSLPTLKTLLLAQYELDKWSKIDIREDEVMTILNKLNRDSYRELITTSRVFYQNPKSDASLKYILDNSLESISFYFKLQDEYLSP